MPTVTDWLVTHEPAVRLTAAAAVAGVFAVAEQLYPRRARSQPRAPRWRANAGILLVDTLALRFLMPVLAVGMALEAERRGWGLFNAAGWPAWVEFLLTLLLLDLVIYGQHWTFHKVPVLWRLHRMHHSDLDFDVSTGLRFHPFEILLSMGIKIAAVAALGAPAAAVVVFEVLLNGVTLFNHANFRLSPGVDRWLRLVVVTPDMHRVHHSVHRHETDSNFGFSFPCWDRLFRTYRAQPVDGHERMVIGVDSFRDPQRLLDLLWQPFTRGAERQGDGR
ncbi:MAG TPA: sterol desaturase family protein [Gammaproteobacteria bacterium]|nr:sterol desaturase family protein [Gammaproteobacteria bacterium]